MYFQRELAVLATYILPPLEAGGPRLPKRAFIIAVPATYILSPLEVGGCLNYVKK
jgi:hypothetical protein